MESVRITWPLKRFKLRKTERKRHSSKLSVDLEIYKSECHNVKRLCRKLKDKRAYYEKKIEDCNNDQKQLFIITEELMH